MRIGHWCWLPLVMGLLWTGCVSVPSGGRGGVPCPEPSGLAGGEILAEMVRSLLESNVLKRADGGRYLLGLGKMRDATPWRLPVEKWERSLRVLLLESRQAVVVSSAAKPTAAALREQEEGGLPQSAGMVPEFFLSSQITGGNADQCRLYMELEDIRSGRSLWQAEKMLRKQEVVHEGDSESR